jgi:hypothetical protein
MKQLSLEQRKIFILHMLEYGTQNGEDTMLPCGTKTRTVAEFNVLMQIELLGLMVSTAAMIGT